MTFFMVFILLVNGEPRPAEGLSYESFSTRSACMATAARRARSMRDMADARGSYLCMYAREPDAALARERVVPF